VTKLKYKIQKALFRFIGDIKWHGWLHPLWITINAKSFMLKGEHYRQAKNIIQPGDILIRRFEGYLDKIFIPGWWNHAGIYIGDYQEQKHRVIHAISDGVIIDDLIDFMRTDHMIVLRGPKIARGAAIDSAKMALGSDYDFAFNFTESVRFSCTELVDYCYCGVLKGKKRFGRMTIVADDIVNCKNLTVIWDSTNGKHGPLKQT